MKSYEQIVSEFRGRKKDTMVDTIAAGITCVDNLAAETGLLEAAGAASDMMENVCGAAPFVVIAATEGVKMVTRRKPVKTGVRDGVARMLKSGAAMGVGAAVAAATTAWAAIPAAMGVRVLCDKHKSRVLTGLRVQERCERLRELNEHIRRGERIEVEKKKDALDVEKVIVVD